MNASFRLFGLAVLTGSFVVSSLTAQVKLPKPPENYDVEFRYRIEAGRNERIVQFTDMMKFLKSIDFKQTVNDDSDLDIFNPDAERMSGTIPSATARRLLEEPHIQTVYLAPEGFKPPADEKDRIKLLLELNTGFTPDRQQVYGLQIKQVLAGFGFQEAVAYDHRGYTILRGTLPWVKAPSLLKDLRDQPAGWFLPLIHEDDRPALLKSKLPIRLIEILPEEGAPPPVMGQAPLPPIAPDQPQAVKFSAELRRRLEATKEGPLRVEAILSFSPTETDVGWKRDILLTNPSTTVDGVIGNVVTLTVAAPDQINAIARLPFILSIRSPRGSTLPAAPAPKDEPKKDEPKEKAQAPFNRGAGRPMGLIRPIRPISLIDGPEPPLNDGTFNALKATRLDRLHAQGAVGAGVRIAIIDTDFTGWQKFVGKQLPRTTHYVDLTAERNSEIQPEASSTPADAIGHGTHCALAVRLAAPDADIVLVRIAPDAPYQLVTVFRYTLKDFFQPQSFRVRRDELEGDAIIVRADRLLANDQYRRAFDDFDDDEAARERKRNAKAAIAAVELKEVALTARANRLLKLESDLLTLGGIKVILNTVGWNSGQPLDATSAIARFLDDKMGVGRPNPALNAARQPQPSLWFQPAGDTRGQGWIGPFIDADGNGIMEFVPPGGLIRPGRWSPELNFLAFRPDAQPATADLLHQPARRLRASPFNGASRTIPKSTRWNIASRSPRSTCSCFASAIRKGKRSPATKWRSWPAPRATPNACSPSATSASTSKPSNWPSPPTAATPCAWKAGNRTPSAPAARSASAIRKSAGNSSHASFWKCSTPRRGPRAASSSPITNRSWAASPFPPMPARSSPLAPSTPATAPNPSAPWAPVWFPISLSSPT